jgi:hypothetical protein
MDAAFPQLSRDFHVAAHTKISGYARPQHRSTAAGENQEQPYHPHNALGYQKPEARAVSFT